MFKTLIKRMQIEKTNNAKQKIVVVVKKVVVVSSKIIIFSKIVVSSNVVVSSTIVVFSKIVVAVTKFVDQQKFVDSKIDEFILKKLRIDINFQLTSNDIIYHIEININRSYIFNVVKKKIFQLTHDENQHIEIHKSYKQIFNILYIFRLSRKFSFYIKNCFNHKFRNKLNKKIKRDIERYIQILQTRNNYN